ncbi:tripartite tricarboxylate transporter TctB family protein [Chelativorans intermedius]|uniref:Tripartite tricarboxylate transporter TctB family protein n=1 Tax=Chelativorans intermedius TaxID=515947 RepID=A0ABV6D674_9HYPH|nr:tripartite tricarboxylate transporter TctB family protein [Chelativorans intermedius]MCT8999390.1 tripartite tricarboxylate transporter TctB family protein [Chelativorans intermedius]
MINRTDLLAGVGLFVLGAAMAIEARGFPSLGGMAFGPDLFPTITAVGLMVSGVGIVAEGATPARRAAAAQAGEQARALWPMLAVLLTIAFFALTLPVLGFHIAAALAMLAAVRVFAGGWGLALSVAIVAPVITHVIFYTFLRVPLPWGLMAPLAW